MEIDEFLEVVQKIVTITAVIVGGVFAYYKYIKGRVFQIRVEPQVSGNLITIQNQRFLKLTILLKNVGASMVKIEHDAGVGVRIYEGSIDPKETEADEPIWTSLGVFPILEEHEWVESGEMLREQLIITMPDPEPTVYKIKLRFVSGGTQFKTTSVATLSAPSNSKETSHASTD